MKRLAEQLNALLTEVKKVGLGTPMGFEVKKISSKDGGGVYYLLKMPKGHNALGYAIAPHPTEKGKWTVDKKPKLGPWEAFINGPFNDPKAAAKALYAKSGTYGSNL